LRKFGQKRTFSNLLNNAKPFFCHQYPINPDNRNLSDDCGSVHRKLVDGRQTAVEPQLSKINTSSDEKNFFHSKLLFFLPLLFLVTSFPAHLNAVLFAAEVVL